MADKMDEVVFSKNVIEFLTVANEYCLFTEKAESYPKEDIVQYYLKICPLLYLKGILLPAVEADETEIPERFLKEEDYEVIFLHLKNKFGEMDEFKTVSEENKEGRQLSEMSLSEQIADIYQDMKDFVMLYQKNTQAAKKNAVAECRKLFEAHWGYKIILIQNALHKFMFGEVIDGSEANDENPEI